MIQVLRHYDLLRYYLMNSAASIKTSTTSRTDREPFFGHGTLITSDYASYYGRDIFAVTGLSEGCDKLIRNGAVPIESAGDVLSKYRVG